MSKANVNRQLRNHVYSLLRQGTSLDGIPESTIREIFLPDEQNIPPAPTVYEIALVAATQAEAERLMALVATSMHKHSTRPATHRFTACGLDQEWSPQHYFDEVHWINLSTTPLPPPKLLARAGRIVHIHQFGAAETSTSLGFRFYRWSSEASLTEFWASLYLAREASGLMNLDWGSYLTWQPPYQSLGLVTSSWGRSFGSAIDDVLTQVAAATLATDTSAILIVEGSTTMTLGDVVEIDSALELNLAFDLVTTGWVSPSYSGYGLKLLTFCQPSQYNDQQHCQR